MGLVLHWCGNSVGTVEDQCGIYMGLALRASVDLVWVSRGTGVGSVRVWCGICEPLGESV